LPIDQVDSFSVTPS